MCGSTKYGDMSDYLTPLNVCLAVFGDRDAVEAIAGSRPKGSYAWAKPSITRQAGDLPAHVQRKMLVEARRRKFKIDPAWLIEGAKRSDVEDFLNSLASDQVAAE